MATDDPQPERYVCTRCGACCRWPGYVRVTAAEIDRIAAHLGMSSVRFIREFTVLTDDRRGLSLTERPDGPCVFLEGDRVCRIYSVRPEQCRDFPNGWRFPGFETKCQARDTWATPPPVRTPA